MPRKPNKVLRIAVPVVVLALGVLVAISIATGTRNAQQKAGARDQRRAGVPAEVASAGEAPPVEAAPAAEPEPAAEPGAAEPDGASGVAAPAGRFDVSGLRARVFPGASIDYRPLGVAPEAGTPEGGAAEYEGLIEFTRLGAGIRSYRLATYFETVEDFIEANFRAGSEQEVRPLPPEEASEEGPAEAEGDRRAPERVTLQALVTERRSDGTPGATAVPFSLLALEVSGDGGASWSTVLLVGADRNAPVWRELTDGAPGRFEAIIEDASGEAAIRVVREFRFQPNSYDFRILQRAENLTDAPLTVRWVQTGPIDLPKSALAYGGDKRRVRFGYFFRPEVQKNSGFVTAGPLHGRADILGPRERGSYEPVRAMWPTPRAEREGLRLVWFAFTGRYFGVAVHDLVEPDAPPEAKIFDPGERIDRLLLSPFPGASREDLVIITRLTSEAKALPPGGVADASIGVYAGPLQEEEIAQEPLAAALNLGQLVVYNFGGMCGWCTFPVLTELLIGTLRFLHDHVVFDWAIAIMCLVVIVRSVLHPINRWSQIRVQRFGAQMSAVGPKMQKVREKYADDPKRQQAEVAKLWREEGINPAGALGCLPLFLQSPIWIALYATLYFAADLRHQPAFFGLFQKLTGGAWHFLADLSSPDSAIPLPGGFSLPLMGHISSINLLPVLLGLVFYFHQKFLTPPQTATLTPEQEQQQKIMKVMMIFLFPVMMYNAPSGLALYFITNSTLAIVENKWIRAHMNKHGLLDPEKIKAEKAERAARRAKPGSFLWKLQQAAKQAQAMREGQGAAAGYNRAQRQAMRKQVKNTGRKEPPNRQYKKRGK